MSTLVISTFTKYSHNSQEEILSQLLTTLQKENILTQIATIAEMRLALVPDANNYPAFIQQEAHYKGQMEALKYLIDCSDEAQVRALQEAQDQSSVQQEY